MEEEAWLAIALMLLCARASADRVLLPLLLFPLTHSLALAHSPLARSPVRSQVERFRDRDQMLTRSAYGLTHLRSCLQFLVTLGLVHEGEGGADGEGGAGEEDAGATVACPLCGDVARSERFARFCSRCGSELGAGAPAGAPRTERPVAQRGAYV